MARSARPTTLRTVLALACVAGLTLASCRGDEGQTASLPAGTSAPSLTPNTPMATPIPATPAAKVVDRRAEAGYSLTVPASWNHLIQQGGVYFSADAPISSASLWEGVIEAGSVPSRYVIFEGVTDSGDVVIRGTTLAELVDTTNAAYLTHFGSAEEANGDVTLDGEPAILLEHVGGRPPKLWLDVIVIHGDRAFALVIAGPPEAAAELRALFMELVQSIRWVG